ncbi:class I SAM-dependent methyltransferase [Bacillus sp. Bva_UNVM-123]|uniref:O-methyltransferase n=1 Tax=Bacillus sp. Bva_UNVM-123 TaxID=2829798 RepID=UPI00391F3479
MFQMNSSNQALPSNVMEVKRTAKQNGFVNSCMDEVGLLLRTLAAQVRCGKIGEIGTGYGIGASWIIAALTPDSEFITIDNDVEKIRAVVRYITGSNIKVVHGDWKEILKSQPFDLLFADGGKAKELEPDLLFAALKVGGTILLDDLTPIELWPDEWKGKEDLVRKYWLQHPKMYSTELRVTPEQAVIIGVKISNE